MSWVTGNITLGWTTSAYYGFGILFENLPTTGESGGSPLLNDGGVAGDEIRWELLSASDVTFTEFNENGSFASNGTGSFTYRSFVNNAAVGDFTATVGELSQAQDYETGGTVAVTRNTLAVTEFIHEQAFDTAGSVTQARSVQADTSFINEQVFESGGTTATIRSVIAVTEFVDDQGNAQEYASGGSTGRTISATAVNEWLNAQDFVSSGVVSTVRSVYAETVSADYDTDWGEPTVLFNEAEPILQISLTFDQLGRPLVFYRVAPDTLKLYWYDPVLQESVTVNLATGIDPLAGFDFPQDTGQSFSDALLFYVRDNTVYMRVQRDRFAVEYTCPASEPGLQLVSNGLRVDNRYQVVYQLPDDGYTPPVVPVPPIPVTGDNYYLNSWGSCFVTNYRLDVVNDPFKLGFKVRDAFFPRYSERGDSAFKQGQVMFGSDGRRQFYCYMQRDTRNSSALINVWRGQREYSAIFELDDFNGEWEFEFRGLNPQVTITKDGVVIFDGWLARPDPNKAGLSLITFAGAIYSANSSDTYPFHGVQYDCWIEHNSNRIDWPVQTKGEQQQPSAPPANDMTILNHRPQNWRLIQS